MAVLQKNVYEMETTGENINTLLYDIIMGDATLFMRADQVEAAWSILMPIIDTWEVNRATSFPNYSVGMQGPADAEALIAMDGQNWIVMRLENENKIVYRAICEKTHR